MLQSVAARPVDRRGFYRSPVTFPERWQGQKPPNAGRKFPVETLTREEARALLAACGRGYAGARDRAGVVLMYRAGLRIAELLALMVKDIDLGAGMVTVLHGKGDRRRTIPVDPQAMALVELWLERRRELGLNGRHPFFCTISQPNPGDPYWPSVVRKKLKHAGERAGITKRVHPQSSEQLQKLLFDGAPNLLGNVQTMRDVVEIGAERPRDLARRGGAGKHQTRGFQIDSMSRAPGPVIKRTDLLLGGLAVTLGVVGPGSERPEPCRRCRPFCHLVTSSSSASIARVRWFQREPSPALSTVEIGGGGQLESPGQSSPHPIQASGRPGRGNQACVHSVIHRPPIEVAVFDAHAVADEKEDDGHKNRPPVFSHR